MLRHYSAGFEARSYGLPLKRETQRRSAATRGIQSGEFLILSYLPVLRATARAESAK
jgi:hypothetical protein